MLQQALSVAGCPGRVPEHSKPRVHRTTHLPASQSQAKRGRAAGRPAMTDHLIRATRIQTGSGRTGKGSWPCTTGPPLARPVSSVHCHPEPQVQTQVTTHPAGRGHGLDSARTHLAISSEPRYRPRIRHMLSRTATNPLEFPIPPI